MQTLHVCGYLECNSEDQHSEDQSPKRPVSKHLQGEKKAGAAVITQILHKTFFCFILHLNMNRF